ncbi:hypothetical protein SOCE26_100040 [Sorangium cellulosum]|uniref:J domain-containing protein n=1 Tax=Sorangium cellulosum TaxID=56 RepID=A0A2L0FA47_SORCE|nr:hypothetical protein [Sorangium cellulosum]AUX48466.1 hypothetical protein SOCE26_100040 [Sorangium cellulosum]
MTAVSELRDDHDVAQARLRAPAVLLADASPEGEAIGAALRARGFDVIAAPLAELEARLASDAPRVVIVDVDQPGAIDMLERLYQHPDGFAATVLLVGDPVRSAELDPQLFGQVFARPVDIAELAAHVSAVAEPGWLRREQGDAPRLPAEYSGPIENEVASHSDFASDLDPLDVGSVLPPPEDGDAVGPRLLPARISPELEEILVAAEQRVTAKAHPSSIPAAEEDVDLILSPELLSALDEPLDPDEDEPGIGASAALAALHAGAASQPRTAPDPHSVGGAPQQGATRAEHTGPGERISELAEPGDDEHDGPPLDVVYATKRAGPELVALSMDREAHLPGRDERDLGAPAPRRGGGRDAAPPTPRDAGRPPAGVSPPSRAEAGWERALAPSPTPRAEAGWERPSARSPVPRAEAAWERAPSPPPAPREDPSWERGLPDAAREELEWARALSGRFEPVDRQRHTEPPPTRARGARDPRAAGFSPSAAGFVSPAAGHAPPGAGFPQHPGAGFPQHAGAGFPQHAGAGFPQHAGAGFPQHAGAGFPQHAGAGFPQHAGAGFPQHAGAGFPQHPGAGFPPHVTPPAGIAFVPAASVELRTAPLPSGGGAGEPDPSPPPAPVRASAPGRAPLPAGPVSAGASSPGRGLIAPQPSPPAAGGLGRVPLPVPPSVAISGGPGRPAPPAVPAVPSAPATISTGALGRAMPPHAADEAPVSSSVSSATVLGPGDAPRALARAVGSRSSGALAIATDEGARRIVLHDGDLVTAGSSIPEETLLAFLVGRGDIEREVAARLTGKLPASGRHAGAALIAHGHLGQDDLWPVLRAHAEWIIGHVVLVEAGTCDLEPEPPGRLKAEPNVFGGATGAEVFVETIRRVIAPEVALRRLGGPGARLDDGVRRNLLGECALRREEEELVRTARGRTVGELVNAAEPENASVIYALVCLEVLDVLIPPSITEAPPPPVEDPLDEEAIRQRVRARLALVEDGDYFSILGIPRDATNYEIRRAYLALRKAFEPSTLLTASTVDLLDDVRLVIEVLDEAYEILREPHRRERYRRAIEAGPP